MRFIVQDFLKSEVPTRQKYLYETFHLWFVVESVTEYYVQLISIPTNCMDILFIAGHNDFVKDYLNQIRIEEKIIVAITCDGTIRFSKFKILGKTIYIARQNESNFADLLDGALYGFDFDLTESEILLYNTDKSLSPLERIKKCFCKL
ncbi:hypothetical protein [uncultured Clostridium sp.]|mgnify:CR=1 FL=1|uniref:hypothetical protein n=1 Tax=uncultured Clostridium sp. TaxID=59620 RepID=UPI0025D7CE04|nr:hypothetical protein [uncultured Clostridium sp.]